MRLITYLFFAIAWCVSVRAELHQEVIEYQQGDQILEGYLAYDKALTAKAPGVLVVHDWMGISNYVKSRADQIASLGYIAFAVDIYGKGVRPQNNQEASEQATKYKSDRKLLRARVNAGLDELRKQPLVDTDRVASIGYCFGGTAALELARSGAAIDGVVTFHGGLDSPTPEDAKKIQCKILVLHGADDPLVPAVEVAAFQDEMRKGDVDWQMTFYSGAVHSFTRPDAGTDNSRGVAYNAKADLRSWEAMKQFFTEIFR